MVSAGLVFKRVTDNVRTIFVAIISVSLVQLYHIQKKNLHRGAAWGKYRGEGKDFSIPF